MAFCSETINGDVSVSGSNVVCVVYIVGEVKIDG